MESSGSSRPPRSRGDDYVLISRDSVATNPDAEVRLDARELEEHLQAGQIKAALELYRDEFLQGFNVRGAPAFDD